MKSGWRIAAVGAALLLTACSSTKLAYNNLDWLAEWHIDDYIDLYGPAEVLFEERFDTLWKWHRRTQLPLYAADLRKLASALAEPISTDRAEAYLVRVERHADRIVEKALPDWADLLAALDEQQVEGFLARLAQARDKQSREIAEGEYWDRREKRLENMYEGLDRWLGSVTPEQKARAEAWADELRYLPELRLAIREESNARFKHLMEERSEPGFRERLRNFVEDPKLPSSEALEALQRHNRAAGLAVLSDLSGMLTPDQRRHLREKLADLAADLEELASEK